MAEDFTKTVRIKRAPKVALDERGRNVWVGKVETVELELVSTMALERILKSGDGKTQNEIRKLVAGRKDGILARDAATGVFQILSDEELKNAVSTNEVQDAPTRPTEITADPISEETRQAAAELSLVSTQVLRKVFRPDGSSEYQTPKAGKKDKFGGFDPYNNS
jgi:hypothetical protein